MTTPPDDKPRRSLVAIGVIAAGTAVVLGLAALLLFVRSRQLEPQARSNAGDPSSVQSDIDSPNTAKPAPVAPLQVESKDYSASNVVSILLGQESDDDGVRHLDEEQDGRTTIETLDGVPCRYHNRKADNKSTGYLYFAIHPDFKRDELKAAAIEVEYRVPSLTYVRLQYDGLEGDTHKRYKSAAPMGSEMTLGTGTRFTPIRASNGWQRVTFQVTNGVFMNSQNGGADFRLEVIPPEIYVRRVSVFRLLDQRPMPNR